MKNVDECESQDVVDPKDHRACDFVRAWRHGDDHDGALDDWVARPARDIMGGVFEEDQVPSVVANARHPFVWADPVEVVEHFSGVVLVEDLGDAGVDQGWYPTLDTFLVRLEGDKEAHPCLGGLEEGASDHLEDWVGEDPKGEECSKDDPVELAEKDQLWLAFDNQATVGKPYEDHPEEEVEGEGVEVDDDDDPTGELQGVTPEHPVLLQWGRH